MNIQIQKEKIFPLIVQVQGIIDKRSLLPVSTNLLLKAEGGTLSIYACGYDLSFLGQVEATVQKEGSLVIDGKKLFEILRELTDEELSLSDELNNQSSRRIRIQQGSSIFKLHCLDSKDYPVFPENQIKEFQKIKSSDLLDVIDKTIYCVSLDESRPALTGVFCESVKEKHRFVATDGHRMSFIDVPVKNFLHLEEGVVIPKKGLVELRRMLSLDEESDLEWGVEKPSLIIKFKSQILSIRLIEGNYPDYRQLLPKEKGQEIILNREDFLQALKRVSVLTSARFKGVNFLFKKSKLSIESVHPKLGEAKEEVVCENSGGDIHIRFNSKYILDILSTIQEDKIKFILKDDVSQGVLKGVKSENHTCVVMPMKI